MAQVSNFRQLSHSSATFQGVQLSLKLGHWQKVVGCFFPLLHDGFNSFGNFLSFLQEDIENQIVFLLFDVCLFQFTQ